MPDISRRALLLGATTLVTIPAGRTVAHAGEARLDSVGARTPGARPPGDAGGPYQVYSGVLGPLQITISLGTGLDAVAVRVTVVNTATTSQTVTVFVTDLVTGRVRQRTVTFPGSRTRFKTFYGHLNHSFSVRFCLPDGVTCLTLGPIGPQPNSPQRTQGIAVPPQTR